MPRLLPFTSVLAAFVGLSGCTTPSSKLPIDKLENAKDDEPQGSKAESIPDPLPVERPTDLLPPRVLALTEASDPAELLGLFTTLDKYPNFGAVRNEMRSRLGADLLDPEQWEQVGLDIDGPVGVGVLDIASEAFFVYATLSDPEAFEALVDKIVDETGQRDEIATADVGYGRTIRIGDELSVILREGVAVMVFVDRPQLAPRDFAATVATIDPRESFGRSETFAWARERMRKDDDGMIFVQPAPLIQAIQRQESDRRNDYGVRYAEEQLEEARRGGAPVEEIRRLEQRVTEEQRWAEERERAQRGEQAMVRELLEPIHAAVVTGDLREDGIDAHAQMLIPGEALLRQLFVPVEAESPLLTALDEPPVFVVDGRLDKDALLRFAELAATADGESLTELNDEIQTETGVDVLGDLYPSLEGSGGLAFTLAKPPDPSKLGKVKLSLGLAAHLGLDDPDTVRRALDDLARNKRVGGLFKRARRGDGWVLEVPTWHEVHLAIVRDRLLASTDKGFLTRVRDAKPGDQAEALAATEHPLRGPVQSPSMRVYQRWAWVALMDARDPYVQTVDSMLYDLDQHPVLSPGEAAEVPHKKAYRKKLRELEKAMDKLNDFERERAGRRFTRFYERMEQLGDAGMQIEALGDGLGMHARWNFAKGYSPFEVLASFWMMGQDDDWDEYNRISGRTYELREELRQLRQAELDDWVAKHPNKRSSKASSKKTSKKRVNKSKHRRTGSARKPPPKASLKASTKARAR